MRLLRLLNCSLVFFMGLILSSCATLQTGSMMQSGRQALFRGDNKAALVYFREVAARNPNYVYGTALRQGIWSYVGRTEYLNGEFPQARQSLERALAANPKEDIARLYLGLTLARTGNYPGGIKEIVAAMKGIYAWLDYVEQAYRYTFGQFWDPGRTIRNAIDKILAEISDERSSREQIIADAEWLGMQMEEEVDRAQEQESRERSREGGDIGGRN